MGVIGAVLGLYPVTCRACGCGFLSHAWRWPFLVYARCPKCAGVRLDDWEERYHWPPAYKRALVLAGARRQRCPSCRLNFVSFRPRWTAAQESGT